MTANLAKKRHYDMALRSASVEETRRRILLAAKDLFAHASYDAVSLEQIADRAEVALKTVLRQFHSKEELLLAGVQTFRDIETQSRLVERGDIAGVARVLTNRY